MLELPPLGNINLHASLLPRYRGAAPIQWAIANGETTTGVTTMRIDAGLDTGDILLQEKLTVEPDDTAETLSPKLAEIGAALTVKTILGLKGGTIRPQPQDNSRATLAPILKKEDGLIDFSRTSAEILNRLRGFQPWPGAYTRFRGKNLQMLRAQVASDGLRPAEIAATTGKLLVGCGQSTALEILELQLEGKKRIPAHDFIQGYRPKFGETLG
jgi:methionyl-tRNA formyltransferase